jgi:parallel beta-helix repeat protein
LVGCFPEQLRVFICIKEIRMRRMNDGRKAVLASGVLVFLALAALVNSAMNFGLVGGSIETIYIRDDGSIDPPTTSILCNGRIYTFTADIYDWIVVQRSNIIIDGNGFTLQGPESGYGLYLSDVAGVRIERVNVRGFYCGVYLYNTSYSTILESNITDNGYGDGIRISYSSYNIILGSNITGNDGRGIWLYYNSYYNIIFGNVLTDNGEGVSLIASDTNTISGNNITNKQNGIVLRWSYNNTLSGNSVSKNYIGVAHRESDYNKLYHNNFINNTIQVYDPAVSGEPGYAPSMNTWDDGYPSGGNFWSDYNGTDLYMGPYQNETGSDGIGDAPYSVNIYNQDRYPSANQWLDTTTPVTLDDYDGLWHSTEYAVNLVAADDKSGVDVTYYRINNSLTKTLSADGQPRITTEGANNTLEYWSVDNAGHEERHHFLTGIKLDKTPPTGSVTINNDAAYTNSTSVTLTLTAFDATSGVCQVRYGNDDVWDTEQWEDFSTTKTWTLTSGDGTKTVYYQIRDNAELISETYSDTIVLDETAPVIDFPAREPADDIQPGQSVKISVNVTDFTSGVKSVTLYYTLNNGSTWEEPVSMDYNISTNSYEAIIPPQPAGTSVNYRIIAFDFAGNSATLNGMELQCVYQVMPEFSAVVILLSFALPLLIITLAKRRRRASFKSYSR